MVVKTRTEYYYRPQRTLGVDGTASSTEPTKPDWGYEQITFASYTNHGGPVSSWKEKIASGNNATSYGEGMRRSIRYTHGGFSLRTSYVFPGPPQLYTWTIREGDLTGIFSPNEISRDLSPVINKAKMRFVQKALDALGSLEGQVFLGELAETLRMIKRPANSFRQGIDSYYGALHERTRRQSKTSKRRILADTWLEYKFGWQPLFHDIEDGFSALRRISERRPAFMPISVTEVDEMDFSPPPLNEQLGPVRYQVHRRHTSRAFAKITGVVSLNYGGLSVPRSELGFRLDRFVPTLWELIPYSFLVDYFSNVGDIISAWSFGTKFVRWAQLTSGTQTLYEHEVPSYSAPGANKPYWQRAEPCKSRGECLAFVRSQSIGSLIPSFRMEIPGMASTKWLNLAALAQTYRSLRPL